jgi:hypothetical protein
MEFAIGIVATITAIKGRKYMFGLAFTFFVYVLYDFSKFYSLATANDFLPILFFLATISAFWSIWNIYKQK